MTKSVTFGDLKPGDCFGFVGDPREHTKIDDRHWAVYVGKGGTFEDEERVVYGRVGVGDNPATLVSRR